jgi:hypothetical protein
MFGLPWDSVVAREMVRPRDLSFSAFSQVPCNAFVLVYVQDPVGEIEKVDKFLGFNRGRKLCEQIAEACHFTKMKEAKDALMPPEIKEKFFKPGFSFYRKGTVQAQYI